MLKRVLKHKFISFLLLFCLAFAAVISVGHKTSHIFDQKTISFVNLSKTDETSKNHALGDCSLCFTSNIFSNFAFMAMAAFFVAEIYLFLVWRDFNSLKLSYLRSTNTSRAPPFIS